MTARILKCLDLCEASGLFDPRDIAMERDSARLGLAARSMRLTSQFGSMLLAVHQQWVHIDCDRFELRAFPDVAEYLSRVATLARECDRVMGGGQ